MIDELLLRQHAEQLGLAITDGMMAELIQQIPNFQLGGEFNPELYRQALRASGLTARGFEQDVRNDLLLRMVPMALSGSAVITEAEIDAMLALENERRAPSGSPFPLRLGVIRLKSLTQTLKPSIRRTWRSS